MPFSPCAALCVLSFVLMPNVSLAQVDHSNSGVTITGQERKEDVLTTTSIVPPVIRAKTIKIDSSGALVKQLHGKVYVTRDTLGHVELPADFRLLHGDLIELTTHSKLTIESAGQTVELNTSSDTSWYKFE